ncbi:hypothetical protein KR044_009196, partial [Drosophila immigrans]
CGNYCFKAIKPVLDYAKNLQSQVDDLKPENLKKLVDVWIEQKIGNLRTAFKPQDEKRPQDIPPGPPFQKIGSKYYYIEESEEVNWFGAVHRCLAMGGHLVSIQNLDEFNAIKEKLQAYKDYWIDINDLDKEGEFISIATGRKAAYFNWQESEPNNAANNEDCGELYFAVNYRMNDDTCNKEQLFIC